MATKTNTEKARLEMIGFWLFLVSSFGLIVCVAYSEPSKGNPFSYSPLIFVAGMAGSALRATRALKKEIADLKSGDADDSPATQDSE